uniref:Uncharacterized protein n=1 Tax=Rhabditophanes sp. KR3021 TaxID=114890 RepID=A0AC35THI7_9BILA
MNELSTTNKRKYIIVILLNYTRLNFSTFVQKHDGIIKELIVIDDDISFENEDLRAGTREFAGSSSNKNGWHNVTKMLCIRRYHLKLNECCNGKLKTVIKNVCIKKVENCDVLNKLGMHCGDGDTGNTINIGAMQIRRRQAEFIKFEKFIAEIFEDYVGGTSGVLCLISLTSA